MSSVTSNLHDALVRLAELNPLWLIALFTVIYSLLVFVRHEWVSIALAAASALCAGFLLSPGGRRLAEATQALPDTYGRLNCMFSATWAGALFDPSRVAETSACRYRGHGFEESSDRDLAAEVMQGPEAEALRGGS